jgi:hypothetical protein
MCYVFRLLHMGNVLIFYTLCTIVPVRFTISKKKWIMYIESEREKERAHFAFVDTCILFIVNYYYNVLTKAVILLIFQL